MVRKARIKLTSTDYNRLEAVCGELKAIADKTGVKMNGPIPLPTKRLRVPVRKTPCVKEPPRGIAGSFVSINGLSILTLKNALCAVLCESESPKKCL